LSSRVIVDESRLPTLRYFLNTSFSVSRCPVSSVPVVDTLICCPSAETTHRIISVAAREVRAVSPIFKRELNIKTHRRSIDCGTNCLECMADAGEPECVAEIPKIEASEQL
jgi:hypothetical protein